MALAQPSILGETRSPAKARREPALLALGLIASAGIFVLDIALPQGILVPVFYVGVILLSRPSRWSRAAFLFASLTSILVVLGHFFSARHWGDHFDLANRVLTLGAIWITAVLVHRQSRMANELREARDRLAERVEMTAATARRAQSSLWTEIEDRHRVEGELEVTEKRYRGLFNQTFQLVATLAPDGTVEEANETLRTIAGLTVGQVSNRPVWSLPIWRHREETARRLAGGFREALSGSFFRDEFEITKADGDLMVLDLSMKPIRDSFGQVDWIILEGRDITQHKRDLEMLVQAQKSEIVGQLTSGVAHDFNNLLTVISGNLELLERRVSGEPKLVRHIDKALNAVFQGRALTDQLLAFARKQNLSPVVVDLSETIDNMEGLLEHSLDDRMRLQTELQSNLWNCRTDPTQLQLALLNLVLNARDSMPQGGRVRIRAANARVDAAASAMRPSLAPGDYVVLSVIDEGFGIPADLLGRVTDPFFTTKPVGKGSGLGLSMAFGFAKQSGGDLFIESTPGRGTSATLYLPRSKEAPAPCPPTLPRALPEHGCGRLLVVEDDTEVRRVMVGILSEAGYEVAEAADGESALAMLYRPHPFDLLIADISMPGAFDGRELAHRARILRPELKVIATSGRPQENGGFEELGKIGHAFLAKPYSTEELLRQVARLVRVKV